MTPPGREKPRPGYSRFRHLQRATIRVRPLLRRRLGVAGGFARWLVLGALALVALVAVGIDLQGLWTTAAAALSLVAIGFVAVWSLLSHMLAAILIVVFRPFELGEHVEIVGDDPVRGEVVDLNPVYTTLRAADGGTLQIPNNLFFQKVTRRGLSVATTDDRAAA
jgi:small-conductance mechanosensitive channel